MFSDVNETIYCSARACAAHLHPSPRSSAPPPAPPAGTATRLGPCNAGKFMDLIIMNSRPHYVAHITELHGITRRSDVKHNIQGYNGTPVDHVRSSAHSFSRETAETRRGRLPRVAPDKGEHPARASPSLCSLLSYSLSAWDLYRAGNFTPSDWPSVFPLNQRRP